MTESLAVLIGGIALAIFLVSIGVLAIALLEWIITK